MEMIKWVKPESGAAIETNDRPETIEYCESLGYTREGEAPEEGSRFDAPSHEEVIVAMTDDDQVVEYAASFGAKVTKHGDLDAIKKRAIAALSE